MSIRTELAKAGRQLDEATRKRDNAMASVKRKIVDAYITGLSVTEISRITGVARQTVYTTLEKNGAF